MRRINPYPRLILAFIAVFLIAGFTLYLLERGVNERCHNYFDALWLTTVFFLSGFEDFGPVSTGGKIISLFMFILGAGIMVVITGIIASVFVQRRMREEKMPKDVERHIVICNWNDGGDRIIKELHAPQAEPETEIVVITPKEVNEGELRKSKAYEKVFFVRSDPTLHDVLKSSRVHLAKSVVLLADRESPDPDAKSALIALAITKLCDTGLRPHIVAEVINHRKVQHLKDAGVDEVVCATDYGLGILAQCTLHAKLSEAYHHLLTYSADTNEIYIVTPDKFPKEVFMGKTFCEAAEILNQNRDPQNPVILVGVRRKNGRVILNPKEAWEGPEGEKFERFEEGDALVVMAYDPPDLRGINPPLQPSREG